MRKFSFLLLFTCFVGLRMQAQCIAHAGPDRAICSGGDTTITLGDTVPVNGGTPPYIYQWTLLNGTSADAYLNDATIPNPTVNIGASWPSDTLSLVLTVTDANGITCKDSVKILHGGSFGYLTSGPMDLDIHQGDSIFLAGWILVNGSNISSYLWRPNTGLHDSTSETFWAKPDITTTYSVRVTNVAGCSSHWVPCYTVNVLPPLGIDETLYKQENVLIYPNPTHNMLFLKKDLKYNQIQVFNSLGQCIALFENNNQNSIDVNSLTKGVYFIKLIGRKEEVIGQTRFIKME